MANVTINQLPELQTADLTDKLALYDLDANTTKKISVQNILNTEINTLTTTNKTLPLAISELNTASEDIADDLSDLNDIVTAQGTNIGTLNTDVSGIADDVDALLTDVSNLNTKIGDTDISSIGDGSVTGAIDNLNTSLGNYVPTSRTINNKALTGNVTLSGTDIENNVYIGNNQVTKAWVSADTSNSQTVRLSTQLSDGKKRLWFVTDGGSMGLWDSAAGSALWSYPLTKIDTIDDKVAKGGDTMTGILRKKSSTIKVGTAPTDDNKVGEGFTFRDGNDFDYANVRTWQTKTSGTTNLQIRVFNKANASATATNNSLVLFETMDGTHGVTVSSAKAWRSAIEAIGTIEFKIVQHRSEAKTIPASSMVDVKFTHTAPGAGWNYLGIASYHDAYRDINIANLNRPTSNTVTSITCTLSNTGSVAKTVSAGQFYYHTIWMKYTN